MNNNTIKIAKLISGIFNPIFSLSFFMLYDYLFQTEDNGSFSMVPIIFMVIIPLVLWIFYKVKKGDFSNHDVSDRHQRKSLYIVIISILTTYLLYEYFYNTNIPWIILNLLILLILLQISNYFIKSSMHVALNLFVAFLFLNINIELGICWIILTILVGISRLILKRHSIAEVFSGALISIVSSLIYIFVFQNLNRL